MPAPTSLRQAQGTLYEYIRKTLQGLPYEATLDNARYNGAGGVVDTCDERPDEENSRIAYGDSRDMHVPAGTDFDSLIAKVGDIWRSWGWRVMERDGAHQPNQHGVSPDGYSLTIQAAYPVGYAPTFDGATPCMPPSFRDESVPVPRVITRDKLLYDEVSATPTR